MSATTAADWRQFREFSAVDLEQSFVLSWQVDSASLLIDIDVLLIPEHPFYERPRASEKSCIRPAIIEFPCCSALSIGDSAPGSIAEIAEGIGHGAIKGLQRLVDGRFEIQGDFGTVLVSAERPLLKLRGP